MRRNSQGGCRTGEHETGSQSWRAAVERSLILDLARPSPDPSEPATIHVELVVPQGASPSLAKDLTKTIQPYMRKVVNCLGDADYSLEPPMPVLSVGDGNEPLAGSVMASYTSATSHMAASSEP